MPDSAEFKTIIDILFYFLSALPDSVILTAIVNEVACNPVLRTSAQATITLLER